MRIRLLIVLLFGAIWLQGQSRKDYAVFFPVTTYAGGWTQLPGTLTECNEIAGDLNTLYGFDTRVWPDKNKQDIKAILAELAGRSYGPDDQLLLWFSMHGYFDEAGDAGCLCPAGARTDDPTFETWLLHTELRTLVTRIPCEHILLVIDACYSGTFPGKKGMPPGPVYQETPDCQTNVAQQLARRTRCYISAGGKERVDAVSQLARKMRSALGGRYSGDDGVLSLKELIGALSEARPEPKEGTFGTDLGGGFVFVPKFGCGKTPAAPAGDSDQKAWNHARTENREDAYQLYLGTWLSGRYRDDAQRALQRLQEDRVWLAAVQKGTADAYQNYLTIYCPGGVYCRAAADNVQTLTAPKPKNELTSYTDPLAGVMVLVKGGAFDMGCTREQKDCYSDEEPVHQVTLSDYYIGKTEVTQAQWRAVMGADPVELYFPGCDNCPVERVSWDDVQKFLSKLNSRSTGAQYRLPTEAEWEYAARGGGQSKGFLYAGSNTLGEVAWHSGNSDRKTHPVRNKQPNELGLYDMTGNVWEWCSDWKGVYPSENQVNPKGPSTGSVRVVRGGSWNGDPRYCRVASRLNGTPGDRSGGVGFRLARAK